MLKSKLQHYAYRPVMTSAVISPEKQLDLLEFFARSYTLGLKQALDYIPERHLRIVAFEDLVAEPERTVTELLAGIGLSAEPVCWGKIGISPNPSRPVDIAPEAAELLATLADRLDRDTRSLLGHRVS